MADSGLIGTPSLQQTITVNGGTILSDPALIHYLLEGWNLTKTRRTCLVRIYNGNGELALYQNCGTALISLKANTENMNCIIPAISFGDSGGNAKAQVNITSTTKGLLIPRMTTTQRDAITSPPEGLLVYNTTTHTLQVHNNTAWANVPG